MITAKLDGAVYIITNYPIPLLIKHNARIG